MTPQRYGLWNSKNHELLAETIRRGGNPYARTVRVHIDCVGPAPLRKDRIDCVTRDNDKNVSNPSL